MKSCSPHIVSNYNLGLERTGHREFYISAPNSPHPYPLAHFTPPPGPAASCFASPAPHKLATQRMGTERETDRQTVCVLIQFYFGQSPSPGAHVNWASLPSGGDKRNVGAEFCPCQSFRKLEARKHVERNF